MGLFVNLMFWVLCSQQGAINFGNAATTLQVEQGPCEPMSARERARLSQSDPEKAPERARETARFAHKPRQ